MKRRNSESSEKKGSSCGDYYVSLTTLQVKSRAKNKGLSQEEAEEQSTLMKSSRYAHKMEQGIRNSLFMEHDE